jgi:hypothetical protein
MTVIYTSETVKALWRHIISSKLVCRDSLEINHCLLLTSFGKTSHHLQRWAIGYNGFNYLVIQTLDGCLIKF